MVVICMGVTGSESKRMICPLINEVTGKKEAAIGFSSGGFVFLELLVQLFKTNRQIARIPYLFIRFYFCWPDQIAIESLRGWIIILLLQLIVQKYIESKWKQGTAVELTKS